MQTRSRSLPCILLVHSRRHPWTKILIKWTRIRFRVRQQGTHFLCLLYGGCIASSCPPFISSVHPSIQCPIGGDKELIIIPHVEGNEQHIMNGQPESRAEHVLCQSSRRIGSVVPEWLFSPNDYDRSFLS